MIPEVDVIVIGGGISGLAAADGLTRLGKSVQVFEARDRLGGRVETASTASGSVAELGPTWFWPGERRVQSLVAELGLAVHEQWTAGDTMVMANGAVSRFGGYRSPPAFRLSGGVSGVVDGLAERLGHDVVALNSAVSSVEDGGDHVIVRVGARAVNSGAVVVALPPSLAMGHGLIDAASLRPDVASTAGAVAVWMGEIVKAVAVYDWAFWREAGLSGFASCQHALFGEVHDMSGPGGVPAMLFGFGRTQPSGPGATAEGFVDQLVALFGSQAASPLEVLIRDWRREAWTTPDSWPPSSRYDLFGSPLLQEPSWDGRLCWCSTETSAIAPGHLEGALAAAERTTGHLARRDD